MESLVSTFECKLNKQWKYSSSVTKSDVLELDGRSASFFRISTDNDRIP